MRKILVSSTLMLSAIIATSHANAIEADITTSGFVDIIWTLSDGTDLGKNGEDKQFQTAGELDIDSKFKQGISLRADADVNPENNSGDSARLGIKCVLLHGHSRCGGTPSASREHSKA